MIAPPVEEEIWLSPEHEDRFQEVVAIYERIRLETDNDYTFQLPSIRQLVSAIDSYRGALDASDTGTGKTAVACAVAYILDLPLFVACPKNVLPPWRRMAKIFGVRCIAINYEMLRRGTTEWGYWTERQGRTRMIKTFHFCPSLAERLLVFDECHRLKDYRTLTCNVGIAAIEAGWRVLALSATACDNPMHMKFVGYLTKLFPHPSQFYGWMLSHGVRKGRFGLQYYGGGKMLSLIHKQIFPMHGSRIRIAELGERFPQTQIISESYEMDDASKIDAIYRVMHEELAKLRARAAKDSAAAKASALTIQLRARQQVELLKVPTFIQMAQDGLAEGMSVVVILNFSESINAQAWSKKLGGQAMNQITGAIKDVHRQELIDDFNADRQPFILMNIKAGGLGISLHGTTSSRPRLVLISPTFSGIDLKQALGRCHRAGGAHSVQKIVWAADTVEEKACNRVRTRLQRVSIFNDNSLDDALEI